MTDTMYKFTRIVVNFDSGEKVDRYTHTSPSLKLIVGRIVDNYTATFKNMDFMRGFDRTETYQNHNWHNELKWVDGTVMCRQHYWKDDTFYVVYWGLERYVE